jgi:hypothetical protein
MILITSHSLLASLAMEKRKKGKKDVADIMEESFSKRKKSRMSN